MTTVCSRCHKNPVKRPTYVCAPCIAKPKKRRASRASSARAGGHAAAVMARSAATTFPIASENFYKDRPTSPVLPPDCAHPPARHFAWHVGGVLCVGCCDCGAVLRGAAEGQVA